jgi:hypothetical protein
VFPREPRRRFLDREQQPSDVVAARCARERRQPVNMIAVEDYDQGALIPAVEELNARRIRR